LEDFCIEFLSLGSRFELSENLYYIDL